MLKHAQTNSTSLHFLLKYPSIPHHLAKKKTFGHNNQGSIADFIEKNQIHCSVTGYPLLNRSAFLMNTCPTKRYVIVKYIVHTIQNNNKQMQETIIGTYQAPVDSNWVITSNTKMDSLTKLATGPATNSLDKRSSSCSTNTLRHRKISQNKMIRTRNCHSLHWQGLHRSTTF